MRDGQSDEPRPGTPSRRALGAMESAVRRARDSAGSGQTPAATAPAASRQPPPRPAARAPDTARSPDRWLVASVAVAAALVVVGAIALAVPLGNSPRSTAPPSTAARVPTTIAGRQGGAGTTGPSHSTSTTTATTVPSTPGAAPVISSLTPSSGSTGQAIQVAGANFMSSNGRIVATFNGQVAPTSCPAQNTCTITVPPPPPGSQSAEVMITTASGTSNAVTFTYG